MELALILLLVFLAMALVLGTIILIIVIVCYNSNSRKETSSSSENSKKQKSGQDAKKEDINYGYYKQESPEQLEEKYQAMQRAQENQASFQMRLMPLPAGSENNSRKNIKLVSEKKIPFPSVHDKVGKDNGNIAKQSQL